jgi:hypothetical protein
MQKLPRKDNHVAENDLVNYALDNGRFNVEKLKMREAKLRIRACCSHGSRHAGQLILANIKPFPYEPDRLIRSADGKYLIELERATVLDVIADAERSARNRQHVDARDDEKRFTQLAFSAWATKEQEAARPSSELLFGTFVNESGILNITDDTSPDADEDDGDLSDDDDNFDE